MGGNTSVAEVLGIVASLVVLAGISVAIIHGDMTAGIITASGNTFVGAIRAATLQPAGK
jgi:hypothetical protein